jgi:hypothetical protein
MKTNYADLPIGTKCFVETRIGWYITYITRFTKTQVITSLKGSRYEEKWRITSGISIGRDTWDCTTLEIFNDKHQKLIDDAQRECEAYKIVSTLLDKRSLITEEDLTKLEKILEGLDDC